MDYSASMFRSLRASISSRAEPVFISIY